MHHQRTRIRKSSVSCFSIQSSITFTYCTLRRVTKRCQQISESLKRESLRAIDAPTVYEQKFPTGRYGRQTASLNTCHF